MAAGVYNFTIEQGSTVDFEIQYKDSSSDPISLAGSTVNMALRSGYGADAILEMSSSTSGTYTKRSGSAFLSVSGSNLSTPLTSGSIGIYIGHAVTDAFAFGEAIYDIELTTDQARTRLLQGKIRLSKDVT